jgi:chromate reductase
MSSRRMVRVPGIAGSLRQGSFNRAMLRMAQEPAPEGMQIDSFDIAPIPPCSEVVRQQSFPAPVEDLRARIKAADGLLIATPEYNRSIPCVLKNAIDWPSRPPEQPFDGKPSGLMGASGGGFGTAGAQYHLRQCFVFLNGNGDEPAGTDDRGRAKQVRCGWQAHRPGDTRVHRRAS